MGSNYRSPFDVGDIFNQTYVLIRPVALGSMAELWEARHVRTPDTVALKIPRHDCDELGRFEREFAIFNAVQHRGLVRCLGRDLTPGPRRSMYLILELIKGQSLARTLRDRRSRDERIARAVAPEVLVDWLSPVFGALEELERLGIVHRDLKPGNIIIGESGAGKIIDLNLGAMPGAPPLTREGVRGGSRPYGSPEQFVSLASADHRSDVFAMGGIVAEALTGLPLRAFEKDDGRLDLDAIGHVLRGGAAPGEWALDAGARFHVHEELVRVVVGALSEEPGQRPPSARTMLDALCAAAGDDTRTVERNPAGAPPAPPAPPSAGSGPSVRIEATSSAPVSSAAAPFARGGDARRVGAAEPPSASWWHRAWLWMQALAH